MRSLDARHSNSWSQNHCSAPNWILWSMIWPRTAYIQQFELKTSVDHFKDALWYGVILGNIYNKNCDARMNPECATVQCGRLGSAITYIGIWSNHHSPQRKGIHHPYKITMLDTEYELHRISSPSLGPDATSRSLPPFSAMDVSSPTSITSW